MNDFGRKIGPKTSLCFGWKNGPNDRGILEGFSFQSSARLFIDALEIIARSIYFASFERHGSGLIRPMHVRTLIAPCHKTVNIM